MNVLFVAEPEAPVVISTVTSGIVMSELVHPINVVPSFVGLLSVNSSINMLQIVGFSGSTVPPFKLYVMLYKLLVAVFPQKDTPLYPSNTLTS